MDEKELCGIVDWSAHKGYFTLANGALNQLKELSLNYSGSYTEFINLISMVMSCDYENADSFANVLTALGNLKIVCKVSKSEEKSWKSVKDELVYQMVICVLRTTLGHHALDDVNFEDESINVDTYRDEVVKMLDTHNLFSISKKNRVYDIEVDNVTNELVSKGKKKVFVKRKVALLLAAHELQAFQKDTCEFVRSLLNEKFPAPVLSIGSIAPTAATASKESVQSPTRRSGRVTASSKGEDITEAAVTSDDFMDGVESPNKPAKKSHKKAAPSTPPPAVSSTHHSAHKTDSADKKEHKHHHHHHHHHHHSAVKEAERFTAVAEEVRNKYNKKDPLRTIIEVAEQVDREDKKKRKMHVESENESNNASPVRKSARGHSSSVKPQSILEDSSDDDDDDDIDRPRINTAFSKLSNLVNATTQKFPAKLDSSPVRRSTKPAPAATSPQPPQPAQFRTSWTDLETKALLDGVAELGFGMWREILNHPRYGVVLARRTNINLKDRFRTLEKQGLLD